MGKNIIHQKVDKKHIIWRVDNIRSYGFYLLSVKLILIINLFEQFCTFAVETQSVLNITGATVRCDVIAICRNLELS